MRFARHLFGVTTGLALSWAPVWSAEPVAPPFPPSVYDPSCPGRYQPLTPTTPTEPGMIPPGAAPDLTAPPATSAFTPAGDTTLASAPQSANPNMFGDQAGSEFCQPVIATLPNGTRRVLAPGSTVDLPRGTRFNRTVFTNIPTTPVLIPGQPLPADAPVGPVPPTPICVGGFKIADNESPRPQNRVFTTYNYFNEIFPRTDLHREIIGFEKTFLGGDASIGMRLPFFQLQSEAFDESDIGDLSVILKYALINDRDSGDVLSIGLVVTAPTGPDSESTILQPFVGAIINLGDFYVHGFSAVAVPSEDEEVTFLFNDIGVGYFLYRDHEGGGCIRAIVPTVEVHVTTPLNHRDFAPDVVDLTAGATFALGDRSSLAVGAVTPLSGPKPFDIEGLVQFNFRF